MGIFVQYTGFQKRTLQTIKQSLIVGWQAIFGTQTDTADEQPNGQIISLFSKALSDGWDGAQEVYNSYDPSMATGAALDRVCALTGVYRISAAATHVAALLYANADNLGAVIPSGRQARRVRGAVVFSLAADATIAAASCQDIYLKLTDAPAAGDVVAVTTTFGTFSVTVVAALDSATMIRNTLNALADQINATTWANAGNGYVSGSAQVVQNGVVLQPLPAAIGGVQNLGTALHLRLTHAATPFGVTSYAKWTVGLCGSVGTFVCTATGPVTLSPDELTEIVTPETGWAAVNNLVAGITGRDVETDEQLRLRRAASFGLGLATDTAIKNALYNRVPGIVSASVVSNRNLETDLAGRPGKCFECTVQGGEDQDIGNAIWYAMPAGILPYGYTTVNVPDSEGHNQLVSFTRPIAQPIFAAVSYKLYTEESFPTDGEALLRAAILNWASDEFTVGKDVFAGRFFGTIYATVEGLGLVTVEVSLNGAAGTWTDYLDIDGRHYAYLEDANLTLTKVV